MENLLLARIDDRLIHGQVMTAWMKVMPAKRIIIVDDSVAKDDFMISVLEMAAPSGVKVDIYGVAKAVEVLKAGLSAPTFILAKTPMTIKGLVDAGVEIDALNIGGMGMTPGRKTLYKNISANDEERAVLKEFVGKGMEVRCQIIPAEKSVDVKNLL